MPCLLLTLLVPIVPIIIHFLMSESIVKIMTVVVSSLLYSVVITYCVILDNYEKEIVLKYIKNHLGLS